jgi:membrane protease YdiL (CAAX protease family)
VPPQVPPVVPVENPPFGIIDVVLIAVFSLIATGLLTAIGFGIVHAIPAWRGYSVAQLAGEPVAVIPPQAVGYLFTLFFIVQVVRRGTSLPFWSAIKWKWPANIVLFFGAGLALSVLIQVGSNFLPIPKTLPIDEFFKTTHAAWMLAVFGVVVAPFFEELFFRGFLYPVLYRRIGFFAAVVLNSVLFAFTHEGQLAHAWAPLLVLFIVGAVLTYVRAKAQSVGASFLVHSGYNAFLFGMIFVATGGFQHMERLR